MKYFLMTSSKTGKIISLEAREDYTSMIKFMESLLGDKFSMMEYSEFMEAQKTLLSCYDVKKINEEVVMIDNRPAMIHNYTEI